MSRPIYIHEYETICALGQTVDDVQRNLLSNDVRTVRGKARLTGGRNVPVGEIALDSNGGKTRCTALAERCVDALSPALDRHMQDRPPERLAVIIGTSTSGIAECGSAFRSRLAQGSWPNDFHFPAQELGEIAAHIARRVGARGPAFGVSTACTSGAKALASAARLIDAGLCDVAIAGGIDTLCELTLNGFAVLDSLSDNVCNPFSANRRGINLGEGGALFILSSEASPIRLAGWGESADAYHMSAPDPEGRGAEAAMRQALERARCAPREIGYLNLHGTATKLNDLMEARAVSRIFGPELACSSTKPMTGHLLGAAGACEAAFAMMALERGRLPAHVWDGERDSEMPFIRLVDGAGEDSDMRRAMSCSYAFGGNNIALILEKTQ